MAFTKPGPLESCAAVMQQLHACKRSIGLLPMQCYPPQRGTSSCEKQEYEFKKCLAHAVDPKAAKTLYDSSAARDARVQANKRLQSQLKKWHQPCTP